MSSQENGLITRRSLKEIFLTLYKSRREHQLSRKYY
jgi:hypothetical protein